MPVTFPSHPLNVDDKCQRQNPARMEDHQEGVSPHAFRYSKHFSVQSPSLHIFQMLTQRSEDAEHLLSHSPCRRHLIFVKVLRYK